MNGAALADARRPDVESGRRGVLVCPVGATEQHGAHLPLGTDTLVAARVAAAETSLLLHLAPVRHALAAHDALAPPPSR